MLSLQLLECWQSDKENVYLTLDLLDSLNHRDDSSLITSVLEGIPHKNSNSPAILTKIIELQIRLQNFDNALFESKKLLIITNNNPLAVHYLLLSYFLLRDYDKVIMLNKQYSLLDESVVFVARSLYLKGDIHSAIQVLIESKITTAESLGVLAIMHLDIGDMNLADKYSHSALEINPEQFEALLTKTSIGCIYHDFANVSTYLDQLLVQQPCNGRVLSLKGQSQLYSKDINAAIDTLLLATKYMPEHIGTWHLLGWAYFVIENIEQAKFTFEHALMLDRNFAESHGSLACVYANQQNTNEANNSITLALKLDKRSFSARFAQALLMVNEGKENEATTLINNITSGATELTNKSYVELINKALKQGNNS